MKKILMINVSARTALSKSCMLTNKFVEQWTIHHGNENFIYRNRSINKIPYIDESWVTAAAKPKTTGTLEEAAALTISDELIAERKATDIIVRGSPMYNCSVPGVLKGYIDQIVRVNETWRINHEDPANPYRGLLGNKLLLFYLKNFQTQFFKPFKMNTMKAMSILLLMFCVIGSCSRQVTPQTTTAADVLQTAGVQMTAFINRHENTISVLYGDSAAFESTQSDFKYHTADEHFVLITYKLKNFYYDYDAQARGAVERVEYISDLDPKNKGEFSYVITVGKWPRDRTGDRYKDSDRVKFIFSHKPYEYPDVESLNK
jgi:FMN-dependent NADH-azoreductase